MDYDVAAVSLAVPPVDAPLTAYRPAITVKNNGRFAAVAAGSISAYIAGRRVYFSQVTSPSIPPGATSTAVATIDWLPEAQGDVVFFGYVSTYRDQNEPNNNLPPVTVHVGPVPPVPPAPVEPHASQHELGGSDKVDVEGLVGVLADPQHPESHAATHQAAGDDQLNVAGLAGVLGEAQVPTNHANEHHLIPFASEALLTSHQSALYAHAAATNLANRETSGPDAGLVKASQLTTSTIVPDPGDLDQENGIRADRVLGPTNSVHHAAKHEAGGLDPIAMPGVTTAIERDILCEPGPAVLIATADLTAAQNKPGTAVHFELSGSIATAIGANQLLRISLYHAILGTTTNLANADFPLAALKSYSLHCTIMAGIGILAILAGLIHGEAHEVGAAEVHGDGYYTGNTTTPLQPGSFYVKASWVNGAIGSACSIDNAIALGVIRP